MKGNGRLRHEKEERMVSEWVGLRSEWGVVFIYEGRLESLLKITWTSFGNLSCIADHNLSKEGLVISSF